LDLINLLIQYSLLYWGFWCIVYWRFWCL